MSFMSLGLVNLNTTQDQRRNHPLARPAQKETSSLACSCTWSAWARARHLVNGGGRDTVVYRIVCVRISGELERYNAVNVWDG